MPKTKDVLNTAFDAYELMACIGEGGAGAIWEARSGDGTIVAVKVLKLESATRERRKRFQNEIAFCESIQHSNIVRVLDHGSTSDGKAATPFYVMPRYWGSFRKLLGNVLLDDQWLRYFEQLLSGVEAAHLKHVTHRDLKPENVLFDKERDVVLVTDFGIAHFNDEEIYTAVETAPSTRLANFMYCAPEQRTRGRKSDERTDIFSLGLILNEMFTGEVPHGIDHKLISAVSPNNAWIDEIVMAMMQSDPVKRPQSIAAVRQLFAMRREEFKAQQRLSVISNQVIPVGEEDDPLALQPVQIIRAEWNHGTLLLTLDTAVNNEWVNALLNMGGYSSVYGIGPETFRISGKNASVSADESEAQRVIDHFKAWLPNATRKYREVRERQRRERAEKERVKLEQERATLELNRRINAGLRI